MSSLGDLLLFHSKQNKAEKVSDSESCDADNKQTTNNRETNQEQPSKSSNFPSQHITDSNNDNSFSEIDNLDQNQSSSPQSGFNKVFPKHVERNEVDETQSNASSTDDYVRELLDPDDRPRNVWHVVEGPKVQQNDDNSSNNNKSADGSPENRSSSSRPLLDDNGESQDPLDSTLTKKQVELSNEIPSSSILTPSTPPPPPSNSPPRTPELEEATTNNHKQVDKKEVDERHDTKHRDSKAKRYSDDDDKKSSSRTDRRHRHSSRHDSRERSSRTYRHKDDRDRDRYHRDRSIDRSDRHRSSRRRDHSDLEDDHNDGYDRNRLSRRRRSHSRSSRTSSSRRRDRSRSNSPSPLTKRNSRTILIMQLSPRVNSHDLEDFFSDIGKVREVRLIMDSKTRRHKGIAYIEFEDSHAATKAFSLNGKKLFGVPLVIQSAQSDRNKSSSGDWHSSSTSHHQSSNNYNLSSTATSSSYPSSRSHLPPNCFRVYVGGLNIHLTEDMIRSVFEPFGPVVKIELMRDRVTNISRGYCFVTYADNEDGQSAIQALDGFELAGKNLRVSKSTDKSERFPNIAGTTTTQGSSNDYGQSSGNNVGDSFKEDNENPYLNNHKYK